MILRTRNVSTPAQDLYFRTPGVVTYLVSKINRGGR